MEARAELIASAEHWERIANDAESLAAWNRGRGLDLSVPGTSAGDYQARSYRATAKALRMEAETGLPHCATHLRPRRDCAREHGL